MGFDSLPACEPGCNALDHFLRKAGQRVGPTTRDLLLVAVATLPALVVDHHLNLQSRLVDHSNRPPASEHESAGAATDHQEAAAGEADLAHLSTPPGSPTTETRLDQTGSSSEVRFPELTAALSRRPSGRELQAALAAQAKALAAAGALSAGTKAPSVTTAKRIRAILESGKRSA